MLLPQSSTCVDASLAFFLACRHIFQRAGFGCGDDRILFSPHTSTRREALFFASRVEKLTRRRMLSWFFPCVWFSFPFFSDSNSNVMIKSVESWEKLTIDWRRPELSCRHFLLVMMTSAKPWQKSRMWKSSNYLFIERRRSETIREREKGEERKERKLNFHPKNARIFKHNRTSVSVESKKKKLLPAVSENSPSRAFDVAEQRAHDDGKRKLNWTKNKSERLSCEL